MSATTTAAKDASAVLHAVNLVYGCELSHAALNAAGLTPADDARNGPFWDVMSEVGFPGVETPQMSVIVGHELFCVDLDEAHDSGVRSAEEAWAPRLVKTAAEARERWSQQVLRLLSAWRADRVDHAHIDTLGAISRLALHPDTKWRLMVVTQWY